MFCGLQPKQVAHLLASIIKGLRGDINILDGSLALLLLLLCVFCRPIGVESIILFPVDLSQMALTAKKIDVFFPTYLISFTRIVSYLLIQQAIMSSFSLTGFIKSTMLSVV